MAYEIERKYLVKNDSYRETAESSVEISQGYLSRAPERVVRVRTKGNRGFITIKGLTEKGHEGLADKRLEFEYEIPHSDAEQLLGLCLQPVLSKTRFLVPFAGHLWEVDEFHGDLSPLVLAEIELSDSGERYELPPFAGRDVTGEPRYYNSNLAGGSF